MLGWMRKNLLRRETRRWVDEGLVEPFQAERILNRYGTSLNDTGPSALGLLTGLAGLRHCEACGKSGCRLFACTKCKRVRYCGPGCQRAAWPQHKSHCRPVEAEG